jgi:O-antigen/teichoic acid export membrane protein
LRAQEPLISRLRTIRSLFDDTTINLVQNALALWGGQLANFGVGFFSLLIYGALFSKPQIAVVNLFQMVVALFLSLGFTWSAIAVVRFGEGEYARARSTAYTSSLRLVLVLPLLIALLGSMVWFREPLLTYIGTTDNSIIAFLAIDLVLAVAREHFVQLFNARERQRVNAAIYFGLSVGKLAVLLLLWTHPQQISAETYVKWLVGVDAFALLAHAALLERAFLLPLSWPTRADFLEMIRFALPQIYGFAALFVINWIDAYFIRMYLTAEDLGGYQFVYTLFTRAAALALILNTIFFPRIMDWNRSKPGATLRYMRRAPLIVLGVIGLIAPLVIICVGPVFSLFFGAKFVAAYPSFYLLLATLPWVYLSYVYVPVLNSRDRVMNVQLGNAVAAFVNVAIDFWLVQRIGIIGAALGTLLAFQTRSLILMTAAHRLIGVPCGGLFIATLLGALAASAYVWATLAG